MREMIVHDGFTGGSAIRHAGATGERVLRLLKTWQRRAADRSALGRLGPRLLADMGITPAEAAREAAKPFWQA